MHLITAVILGLIAAPLATTYLAGAADVVAVEIHDTPAPNDDYLCWSPVPARIRLLSGAEAPAALDPSIAMPYWEFDKPTVRLADNTLPPPLFTEVMKAYVGARAGSLSPIETKHLKNIVDKYEFRHPSSKATVAPLKKQLGNIEPKFGTK